MQEALKNARFTILRSFSKFVKQSFSVLNVNVARPYFWNFKLGFRNSGTINIISLVLTTLANSNSLNQVGSISRRCQNNLPT